MPLRLILSPYSLSASSTKLIFTTTHVAPGERVITMKQIAEIPEVTQPDEKIMDCIESIVDQIIQDPCSIYFLRPVDPDIDNAPTYYQVITYPIDLGTIRKKVLSKNYSTFKVFVDDITTLIKNATVFNPLSHPVHQAALKMSVLFRDLILQLNQAPEEFLKNHDPRKAENIIAKAMETLYNQKKQRDRARKASETKKVVSTKSHIKLTSQDIENLAQTIKSLPSSALIGVVEILTKSDFSLDKLPLNIDLQAVDTQVIDKLKRYVDSIKKDTTKSALYAWRPFEPKDLADLREQYAAELQSWKEPPPDKTTLND